MAQEPPRLEGIGIGARAGGGGAADSPGIRRILVSGACGGLGSAVTDVLSLRGASVFAADCDSTGLSARAWPSNVKPLHMDVTDPASVARGIREAESALGACAESSGTSAARPASCAGGLNGLVCCAGIFTGGALAETGEEALARAFDVNVLGAFRLVKEAFPLLVRGCGTVVLISSESARFAMPFNGPYTIGKYALEAYADCLRRELLNTGVKVVVVQPGSFRTGMLRNAAAGIRTRGEDSPFTGPLATVRRLLSREWDKAMEADRVARVVVRALYARRPRPRYRVGNDPLRVLLRVMPSRTADALVKRFL